MLKFVVVLYKRSDMSRKQFRDYFRNVHGPLAQKLPGLRKYTQNYVLEDLNREHPGWDGIAELYFDDWESMEAAWASLEGEIATNDLVALADLEHTTWSVVEEVKIISA